jgi:hypothetical protein
MRAVLFALGGSAWVGDGEQGRDAAPPLLVNWHVTVMRTAFAYGCGFGGVGGAGAAGAA